MSTSRYTDAFTGQGLRDESVAVSVPGVGVQSAKLTFGGVGLGPGYAADCMLEDTATRQCLIRKGDKPPAWQGPDLQAAQVNALTPYQNTSEAGSPPSSAARMPYLCV